MKTRGTLACLLIAILASAAPVRAESPKDKAAKLMKKLATDRKVEVRADAARQLGDMGAWDAVPALAQALKDPADEVREGAAYALVELKDHAKPAIPALKEALTDQSRLVRYNAIAALSNLDGATTAELAAPIASLLEGAEDKDDMEKAVELLVELGLEDATSRKVILDVMDHGSTAVRAQLMQQMWHEDSLTSDAPWKAEVVAHLVPLVTKDPDAGIRRQAIVLLWRAKATSGAAGDALIAALDDPSKEVASQAAGTLNGLEHSPLPTKAIAHLTTKLKSTDPKQRASAANALGGFIGWREKFTPLLTTALLTDKDPAVRLAVVGALGEIDDDAAIPSLIKSLKADTDPKVRAAICTSWAKPMIKLRFERTNTLAPAMAALEAAKADPNNRVSMAAEAALTELRK